MAGSKVTRELGGGRERERMADGWRQSHLGRDVRAPKLGRSRERDKKFNLGQNRF